MVNKKLEQFLFILSFFLFAVFVLVVMLFLDHKARNLGVAVLGYAISLFMFEATAMLFRSAGTGKKAPVIISSGVLVSAFIVMLVALYLVLRVSMESFWVLFGGIVAIPASVMVYSVLEATGITHTGFYL